MRSRAWRCHIEVDNQGQRYEQPSILPAPPKGWNDITGDASSQSGERVQGRWICRYQGGYAETAHSQHLIRAVQAAFTLPYGGLGDG